MMALRYDVTPFRHFGISMLGCRDITVLQRFDAVHSCLCDVLPLQWHTILTAWRCDVIILQCRGIVMASCCSVIAPSCCDTVAPQRCDGSAWPDDGVLVVVAVAAAAVGGDDDDEDSRDYDHGGNGGFYVGWQIRRNRLEAPKSPDKEGKGVTLRPGLVMFYV